MEIHYRFKNVIVKNKNFSDFPKLTHTQSESLEMYLNIARNYSRMSSRCNFIGILIFNLKTIVCPFFLFV